MNRILQNSVSCPRIPGESAQVGRLDWRAVYARSYYKLGRLHEQMGKNAEAGENYRKFLGLWKDADPGLPEVEDARQRLSKAQ